ncbi:hypothetical protein AJ80_08587 [Polytolypa hystricis UAMH7299]|uniref:Uncharacterized protein n=1 Tax=Polytolypa hystricis (strain UAMH7299) TaxID=1447883 RepID=A0A2B7X5E6_POLH7|nr:hypothetical protein AJ80_08587 [Polytolypa hystricis UAMH7299]
MRSLALTTLLFLLLTPFSAAFWIYPYQGPRCSAMRITKWLGGPTKGCQTNVGKGGISASSAIVKSTGPVDDPHVAVFFSSTDCNPETEIGHSDDGCVTGNIRSFEVWNVETGD